jgi:hypothetical protein
LWEAGRVEVLASTRAIAPGETIADGDLRVVEVAVDAGVATVAATELEEVVGRTATVGLAPGQLVAPGAVGDDPVVDADHATVGLVLQPGHYPPGIGVGDHYLAVALPSDSAAGDGVDPVEVEVVHLREPAAGQSAWSATLLVPRRDAERLIVLAAQSRLGLVGVGAGG